MVQDLFATPGAGQDVDVSVFANDVVTVQTAEIGADAADAVAAARPVRRHTRHPELLPMRLARTLLALVAAAVLPSLTRGAQTLSEPATIPAPASSRAGSMPASRSKNMRLVSFSPKPAAFDTARGLTFINSDLAFGDKYVYQGNFAGLHHLGRERSGQAQVIVAAISCITSQGDPSIYGNLLFLSAEGGGNRNDCAKGGVQDPKDHMAGVRIYDVVRSGAAAAGQERADLQGLAHPHDRPEPEGQDGHLHLRLGEPGRPPRLGAGGVQGRHRPGGRDELALPARRHQGAAGPSRAGRGGDGARIFTGLDPAPRAAGRPAARRRRAAGDDRAGSAAPAPTGPRNCHDVTAYPAMNLLAGACAQLRPAGGHLQPAKSRSASTPWPTPTSRSGTRRSSATTARRSCSPTSGAAAPGRCARPTRMMEMGGNTILTIDAQAEVHAARLLQDPHGAVGRGELRVAQRRAGAGAGARHHGAGLVPGWHQRHGVHRPGPPAGAGVLRSRPDRSAAGRRRAGHATADRGVAARGHDRRVVGRLLLERPDLLVRAGPRIRHPRAAAERAAVGERDRGGEAGAVRAVQSAEPAEDRVAGGVPGGPLVSRPAGALERPGGGPDDGDRAARSTRRSSSRARPGATRSTRSRSRWTRTWQGRRTRSG